MPITTENPGSVEFGAVYFRKSNPPRQDWDRDYGVAKADGHTLFRHWVPWGAVELAPGEFDWADYDEHLDLAARHGIKTVLAEMIVDVPEWIYHKYPHARREQRDGVVRRSEMHTSCVTGGHHAMCLDNPDFAEEAGRFLRALAARYKDHAGMYAYDVWNECSHYHPELLCYCPATQVKFRTWLKQKYGSLKALATAWRRYSFTSWDEVELSREVRPYPDVMDGIQFQIDNAYALMKWRVDQLKSVDTKNIVSAHGNAKTHVDASPACGDDWRAGELVDLFGYTYWYDNDCDPVFAGDMIRSASRGREFWRAEAVGDSDWVGRKAGDAQAIRQDDMHDPKNIRLDCMISLLTGSRGFLNPRWRPLLDGPLFGAFGWYGMDGSRTDRSDMIKGLATWANTKENQTLWRSRPVRGEVAILFLDEAQNHCYAMHGDTEPYSFSVQGAYEAFQAVNVQADLVKLDQIDGYQLLYVPFSLALTAASIETLTAWVKAGGTLIGEAAFGYFDEQAHAFPQQPSRGLAELFGAREASINFGADRWGGLDVTTSVGAVPGGLYRQSYTLAGGDAAGTFEDGAVAIVDHAVGKGRTRLVGTMPGYGYKTRPTEAGARWFASLVGIGGGTQRISHDGDAVVARLTELGDEVFLWVVNRSPETQKLVLDFGTDGPGGPVTPVRGTAPASASAKRIELTVEGRDASIVKWTR